MNEGRVNVSGQTDVPWIAQAAKIDSKKMPPGARRVEDRASHLYYMTLPKHRVMVMKDD